MLRLLSGLFKFMLVALVALVVGALVRWNDESLSRRVETVVLKMEKGLRKSPSTQNAIKQMETWTARWTSSSPKKASPSRSNSSLPSTEETHSQDQRTLKKFLDTVD